MTYHAGIVEHLDTFFSAQTQFEETRNDSVCQLGQSFKKACKEGKFMANISKWLTYFVKSCSTL